MAVDEGRWFKSVQIDKIRNNYDSHVDENYLNTSWNVIHTFFVKCNIVVFKYPDNSNVKDFIYVINFFNMKIWFVKICYRDTIPHCYYLIDIFMIFNLYYISCTYVKPMNCMVLGIKQYNTINFQYHFKKDAVCIVVDELPWQCL